MSDQPHKFSDEPWKAMIARKQRIADANEAWRKAKIRVTTAQKDLDAAEAEYVASVGGLTNIQILALLS